MRQFLLALPADIQDWEIKRIQPKFRNPNYCCSRGKLTCVNKSQKKADKSTKFPEESVTLSLGQEKLITRIVFLFAGWMPEKAELTSH
jgi:hypothetical protein